MGQRETESEEGPYNQVVLTTGIGEPRRLTRREFESLPLDERVRSILQKRLKFYRRGLEVPVREALKNH